MLKLLDAREDMLFMLSPVRRGPDAREEREPGESCEALSSDKGESIGRKLVTTSGSGGGSGGSGTVGIGA